MFLKFFAIGNSFIFCNWPIEQKYYLLDCKNNLNKYSDKNCLHHHMKFFLKAEIASCVEVLDSERLEFN